MIVRVQSSVGRGEVISGGGGNAPALTGTGHGAKTGYPYSGGYYKVVREGVEDSVGDVGEAQDQWRRRGVMEVLVVEDLAVEDSVEDAVKDPVDETA